MTVQLPIMAVCETLWSAISTYESHVAPEEIDEALRGNTK